MLCLLRVMVTSPSFYFKSMPLGALLLAIVWNLNCSDVFGNLLGNCLYYALSDQLYGDFSHAEEIRIRLADHISNNSEYFMSFIAAAGGTRRAPRRAAASAAKYSSQSRSSSSASPVPPSSQDKEQSFNSKVAESRRTGVWGGAEEIQACCQSFKKDIHVYTMYGIQIFRDVHAPDGEEREVLHIAFHVCIFLSKFLDGQLLTTMFVIRTSITTPPSDIPMDRTPECLFLQKKESKRRQNKTQRLLAVPLWKWPLHGKYQLSKKASGANMTGIRL